MKLTVKEMDLIETALDAFILSKIDPKAKELAKGLKTKVHEEIQKELKRLIDENGIISIDLHNENNVDTVLDAIDAVKEVNEYLDFGKMADEVEQDLKEPCQDCIENGDEIDYTKCPHNHELTNNELGEAIINGLKQKEETNTMYNLNKKPIRLYHVTFNSYSNVMRDTVSNNHGFESSYIKIPKTGLIVREDELDVYREYGNGFESIKIVGEMYISEVLYE